MNREEILENDKETYASYDAFGGRFGCMMLGNGIDTDAGELLTTVSSFPPGHLLTIASTRSGKGTSQIIPNLLLYEGSVVVIDPKGENYARTHEERRKFGRVLRIDPFRVTKIYDPVSPFSACNPMDFIEGESEARRLASLLLGDGPKGDNRFFHDEAVNLLSATILACASTRLNKLDDVRVRLTVSNASHGGGPSDLDLELETLIEETTEPGAQRRLRSFLGYGEKLQSSILATINAGMAIWDTPELADAISRTDLPFADLKTETATIYVVLPFDKMSDYGSFLRLMVGQFHQAMIKGKKAEGIPVACIIDEFPTLGSMNEVVRALAEVAGYGVRFWLFIQNLSQIKSLYPDDWNTIVSQCSTVSVFGVTDGETVDWLGKELGQRTRAISVPTTNIGGAGRDADGRLNVNGGVNHGVQLAGTPLLTPGEIRKYLGVGQPWQIVLMSGKRPLLSARVEFYNDDYLSQCVGSLDGHRRLAAGHSLRESELWIGERVGHKYGFKKANDDV